MARSTKLHYNENDDYSICGRRIDDVVKSTDSINVFILVSNKCGSCLKSLKIRGDIKCKE